jgi:hypothetical protein
MTEAENTENAPKLDALQSKKAALEAQAAEAAKAAEERAAEEAKRRKEEEKRQKITSLLMLIWNSLMGVSIAALCLIGVIYKDSSAFDFAALGVVGLLIPHLVGMYRIAATARKKQEELDQLVFEAKQEKIRQAMELAQQQKAAEEAAAQESLKVQEKWEEYENELRQQQIVLRNINIASITSAPSELSQKKS